MASDSSKKKMKRREKANSSVDKPNNGMISAKVMDVEKMPKEELRRYMFPCLPMESYVEEPFTHLLGCSSSRFHSTPERSHVTRVSIQLSDSISKERHSRSGKYQSKYHVEIGKPLDVKSLLFPSRKGHLVRRRKLQKRLNAKNLNLSGKYVMLCCFMVPLDWNNLVAHSVAVACHDLYSKMKNQFEMVIVAIMRDGWTDDKKAFTQFMSAFPSSCLAIPFHAKSHRRYVCKHLGGMNMCKITLVAPDGNVLLHDEVRSPWDLEFVPWYHLANSHPFPFVTDPDAGSHLTVPSSLEDLLYCRTTTEDFVFRKKKKKKNTEPFEKEKLPVSQLKSKLVGLHIYGDGSMFPWLRKIEDACRHSDKELEIVVVFPPCCWWYPEYFSTVLAKQNLSWWVAPYNNTTSIMLEHLFEREKVIIVGPNGSYIDSYGAELMQLYGISAYPFTVNHVLQTIVAELRKVTLESFFEFLNMPFEHHLHHIGKKNILFYFDHPCFIDSVVYDAYTRFTSDTNALILPCSIATELTDLNRDYPEQVRGGKLSWHSACVAGNNVHDKFFRRFFNFEFSTIVAFGKDGLICSVLAHRLPYSRGDKSFSVKGDLLEEVSYLLADHLKRYDYHDSRHTRNMDDLEELQELRQSWV